MKHLLRRVNFSSDVLLKLKVMKDCRAQDLIEYALMAGFVAVAAGAIMPNVATYLVHIFCNVQFDFFLAGAGDPEPGACEAFTF